MLKNLTSNIYHQARQKYVLSNAFERYCKVQFAVSYSTISENTDSKLLDIQHDVSSIYCDDKPTKDIILQDMLIYNDFITKEEEESLFNEVEPYLKRMRYEYSHWDNVSEVPHRNNRFYDQRFWLLSCTYHESFCSSHLHTPISGHSRIQRNRKEQVDSEE